MDPAIKAIQEVIETNERLDSRNRCLEEVNSRLKEENERLKRDNAHLKEDNIHLTEKNKRHRVGIDPSQNNTEVERADAELKKWLPGLIRTHGWRDVEDALTYVDWIPSGGEYDLTSPYIPYRENVEAFLEPSALEAHPPNGKNWTRDREIKERLEHLTNVFKPQ
jgi:hypothetical protein